MKCKNGFITIKDPLTKRQVPFFLKFRSQDVVVTDAVDIEEYMVKTSGLYDLKNSKHVNEYSMYHYTADVHTDGGMYNTESVFGNNLVSDVTYLFYKDGRLEIYGNARTKVASIKDPLTHSYPSISGVRVPLPYGFTNEWENKHVSKNLGVKLNYTELYNVLYHPVYIDSGDDAKIEHYDGVSDSVNSAFLGKYKVTNTNLNPPDNSTVRYMIESMMLGIPTGNNCVDLSFNIRTTFR